MLTNNFLLDFKKLMEILVGYNYNLIGFDNLNKDCEFLLICNVSSCFPKKSIAHAPTQHLTNLCCIFSSRLTTKVVHGPRFLNHNAKDKNSIT